MPGMTRPLYAHPLQAQDAAPVEPAFYTTKAGAQPVAPWGKDKEYCVPLFYSAPSAGVQGDAARLDWIEEQIASKGSVWLLPCGESLRFLQVRHAGHCQNYPTVEGLRQAIDAAIAQSTKGA
jgi:hypothetical protein